MTQKYEIFSRDGKKYFRNGKWCEPADLHRSLTKEEEQEVQKTIDFLDRMIQY